MFGIAAGGDPGNHVVAPVGREGLDEHELRLLVPGEGEGDVVGLHQLPVAGEDLLRQGPEILLVVKDLHVVHVVGQILDRLDLEHVLRVADVLLEGGRHLLERLEEVGEGAGVGLDNGIVGVDEVERGGALVGVDDDLDAVADVVDAPGDVLQSGGTRRKRLAVGEVVANGVGVDDPVEAVIGGDDVGIVVLQQEGRDAPHPLLDLTVHHDPGLIVDVLAEEQVRLAKANGEGEAGEQAIERDAAVAVVGAVDVRVGRRVVELCEAAVDVDHVVGQLPIVDLGAIDLQVDDAFGR